MRSQRRWPSTGPGEHGMEDRGRGWRVRLLPWNRFFFSPLLQTPAVLALSPHHPGRCLVLAFIQRLDANVSSQTDYWRGYVGRRVTALAERWPPARATSLAAGAAAASFAAGVRVTLPSPSVAPSSEKQLPGKTEGAALLALAPSAPGADLEGAKVWANGRWEVVASKAGDGGQQVGSAALAAAITVGADREAAVLPAASAVEVASRFDHAAAGRLLDEEVREAVVGTALGAAGSAAGGVVLTWILPNGLEDFLALAVAGLAAYVGVLNLPLRRAEAKAKLRTASSRLQAEVSEREGSGRTRAGASSSVAGPGVADDLVVGD